LLAEPDQPPQESGDEPEPPVCEDRQDHGNVESDATHDAGEGKKRDDQPGWLR
jgi:hypothetical protein